MPLLDEGAHLVAGDVHAVEVSVAVKALNFLALNTHLSPGLVVGILVQVTERDLEDTATEGIGGDFYKMINILATVKETRQSKLATSQPHICLPVALLSSFYLLCPAVLLQGVKVGSETSKVDGTFTLYHSFLMKG